MKHVKIDNYFEFTFQTQRFDTGVATDADSTPTYRVYEENNDTVLDSGNCAKRDDANTTGYYYVRGQCTAALGYEVGKSYEVRIAATVNSVAGSARVGSFMVLNALVFDSLYGTDKLQVDLQEWIGVAPLALSSQQVQVLAAAIANDAITAAAIANGAIDNATFAADVGSTAYATNIIALASNKALANTITPLLPTALAADGGIKASVVGFLGTAITETAGQIAAAFKKFFDKSTPTGTINSLPDAVAGATGGVSVVGSKMDIVDLPNTTALNNIVKAIWDAATSGMTAVGSLGKKLADWVVGTIDTYTGNTKQTGDAYSVANTRLPAALVSGRMDSHVNDLANDAITAASIAADAIGASELAADAVTEIGGGVWATGELGITTPGSIGLHLASAIPQNGPATTGGLPTVDSSNNIAGIQSSGLTAIGTAVWASTTRTLSSFGTLVADIATAVWGAVTRTLTAGTNIVLAKGTGITGFNDIAAGAQMDLVNAPNATAITAFKTAIRQTAMTESYAADGAAPTLEQCLFLIQQVLTEFATSGVTLTVKKLDGSTTAATFTFDDATDPTSLTRTT